MDASPDDVWNVVSDITNIGLFSPETFEAEWLDGATGPAVGTRFRGHVRRNGRGPTYWTVCRIDACEPGTEFAFTVVLNNRDINTWRYRMEPAGEGGTDVTESFQLADRAILRLYWAVAGRARRKTNLHGMRATLQRIKKHVETPNNIGS